MSKLVWDADGAREFETGVENCALYPMASNGSYETGVAWNGIMNITESPEGGEPQAIYADNMKYLELMSIEDFGGKIEAYMSPEEFDECDGTKEMGTSSGMFATQQTRKKFGLAYITKIGNDVNGDEHGEKIHVVYGALAKPSEKAYNTINNDPEAITFSWDFSTTPVAVTGLKPTAHLIIDTTAMDAGDVTTLKDKLFGADASDPTLLLPDALLALIEP